MANINKGYIIYPREFPESHIDEKPPHFREIYRWLLKEAAHKEIKTRYGTLKRGQLFTTYNLIREGLKWYVGRRKVSYECHNVETALKYLLKTGMITTTKTTCGLLITICKYDYYQDARNYENQTENQTENGKKARRKPDDKQELNNNNNSISVCKHNTHTHF